MTVSETCIICGRETDDMSIEHIIPDAIGGRAKIRCVCKMCNSKLGDRVDYPLIQDDAAKMYCMYLGIKNRDRKAITITDFDIRNENGEKMHIKRGDGKEMPFYYDGTQNPEVSFTKLDSGGYRFTGSGSDYQSLYSAAKRKAKKMGIEIPDEKLNALFHSELSPKYSYSKGKAEIVLHWDNYIPCIAKIAYEVASVLLAPQYNDDPQGRVFQRFLYHCCYDGEKPQVDFPVWYFETNTPPHPKHTMAMAICPQDNILWATILLFGKIGFYLPLSYEADKYYVTELENIDVLPLIGGKCNA